MAAVGSHFVILYHPSRPQRSSSPCFTYYLAAAVRHAGPCCGRGSNLGRDEKRTDRQTDDRRTDWQRLSAGGPTNQTSHLVPAWPPRRHDAASGALSRAGWGVAGRGVVGPGYSSVDAGSRRGNASNAHQALAAWLPWPAGRAATEQLNSRTLESWLAYPATKTGVGTLVDAGVPHPATDFSSLIMSTFIE